MTTFVARVRSDGGYWAHSMFAGIWGDGGNRTQRVLALTPRLWHRKLTLPPVLCLLPLQNSKLPGVLCLDNAHIGEPGHWPGPHHNRLYVVTIHVAPEASELYCCPSILHVKWLAAVNRALHQLPLQFEDVVGSVQGVACRG